MCGGFWRADRGGERRRQRADGRAGPDGPILVGTDSRLKREHGPGRDPFVRRR